MFEYIKDKSDYYIRCLHCEFIDRVKVVIAAISKGWTCARCKCSGDAQEVKPVDSYDIEDDK